MLREKVCAFSGKSELILSNGQLLDTPGATAIKHIVLEFLSVPLLGRSFVGKL